MLMARLFPFLLDSIETGWGAPSLQAWAGFPFLLDSIETCAEMLSTPRLATVSIPLRFD